MCSNATLKLLILKYILGILRIITNKNRSTKKRICCESLDKLGLRSKEV